MKAEQNNRPVPNGTTITEPISIFAHQLKKPLAVARSYLEVLYNGDLGILNEKQKEYVHDALENISGMTGILTMLFDVSRIDEKKYEVVVQSTDLAAIVERAIAEMAFWAGKWHTLITLHAPRNLPRVMTDPLKIKDAVGNFISNAVKYKTPGKKGKVDIRLEKKGKFVMFSCRDNGMGISSRDTRKLFTKFFRSGEAVRIDPVGTGLGLYINKAVITLSGGDIWLKKNASGGLTFYFSLPIDKKAVVKK